MILCVVMVVFGVRVLILDEWLSVDLAEASLNLRLFNTCALARETSTENSTEPRSEKEQPVNTCVGGVLHKNLLQFVFNFGNIEINDFTLKLIEVAWTTTQLPKTISP